VRVKYEHCRTNKARLENFIRMSWVWKRTAIERWSDLKLFESRRVTYHIYPRLASAATVKRSATRAAQQRLKRQITRRCTSINKLRPAKRESPSDSPRLGNLYRAFAASAPSQCKVCAVWILGRVASDVDTEKDKLELGKSLIYWAIVYVSDSFLLLSDNCTYSFE
jgi:hypothetical protein